MTMDTLPVGTTPASSPERGFGAYTDLFTRAAASLLVVIYGIDFTILAVYEAHYGVVQFSPLRARIFLVGFAFTALVALPAAAQHYKLAFYGPLKPVLENADPALQNYRHAVLILGFVYTAYLMASLFSWFLFAPSARSHPWWHSALPVLGWLILLGAYSLIGKRFTTHPKGSTGAAVLATAGFIGGLYLGNENVANLTLWFFSAGALTLDVRRSPDRLRFALDFRNWFSAMLSLSFFILAVFGTMQPKFGGGAPAPVVLYLNKPVAWLDSPAANVSLLDETEQGFYVLVPGKTRALFIPRNDVASVYFGPIEDVTKSK